MSEPVSIAVFGAVGLIGKRHTQHCLDEPAVVLSAIVEPTPQGAPFADKLGVPCFASVDDLLSARAQGLIRVDGAILATPNSTHVPLTIALIRAGVHVLVEKPVAPSFESGSQLLQMTQEPGVGRVLVGHHRRFNPYILKLNEILRAKELGQLLAVSGIWAARKPADYFEGATKWRTEATAGGVILINLVHDIDLLRSFVGEIDRVYCERGISTRGHPVEETGACTLHFANGVVGTFIFSDAAASPYNFEMSTGENPTLPQYPQYNYTLLGTKGSTSFPDLRVHKYESQNDGNWTDRFVEATKPQVDQSAPFTHQLRHFVRVVRGIERPACDVAEALQTAMTIDAIKESMNTGKPVQVRQVHHKA